MTRRELEHRAAKALARWRRRWLRESSPPDPRGGWTDTMEIWHIAGQLIESDRKRKRRDAH